MNTEQQFRVGESVPIKAKVKLGDIQPDEVSVQVFEGRLSAKREIVKPRIVDMTPEGAGAKGVYTYTASIPCGEAGRHGFVFRILPRHDDLADPHDTGLIFWA